MDAAVIFVEEVQQRRWWRARDILILPGNHDVVFGDPPQDMESISRVVIPLPKAERERLYRETYRRIRLATGVARTTRLEEIQSADSMGVLKADKSTRIAILGLDSTRVEGWSNPGLGFVGYDQLWAMAECLFKDYEQSDTPWRRIAFMHHHVLPMDEVSVQAAIALQWNRHFTLDYAAADLLQGAQDYKIDFLIHGHFHRPKVRAADNSTARPGRVLSAGSPSVRDGDCDSLHQFFLHELFDSMNRPRVSLRNSG
jgi:UDP-2,3-diacylglucosamine pyrophosphatase LpxH